MAGANNAEVDTRHVGQGELENSAECAMETGGWQALSDVGILLEVRVMVMARAGMQFAVETIAGLPDS